MSDTELKPCPFCGCDEIIFSDCDEDAVLISCGECRATQSMTLDELCFDHDREYICIEAYDNDDPIKLPLINLWNTRADRAERLTPQEQAVIDAGKVYANKPSRTNHHILCNAVKALQESKGND